MGRFAVQIIVANNRDVVNVVLGDPIPASVNHCTVSGIVDSGPLGWFCRKELWSF